MLIIGCKDLLDIRNRIRTCSNYDMIYFLLSNVFFLTLRF